MIYFFCRGHKILIYVPQISVLFLFSPSITNKMLWDTLFLPASYSRESQVFNFLLISYFHVTTYFSEWFFVISFFLKQLVFTSFTGFAEDICARWFRVLLHFDYIINTPNEIVVYCRFSYTHLFICHVMLFSN